MKYLLDTHTIIWAVTDSDKLSINAKEIIEDAGSPLFVSAISFWDISIKFGLGKLEFLNINPMEILKAVEQMGIEILPLGALHCTSYHQMPAQFHKDPFDKMLIWLSLSNGHTLISKDENIQKYTTVGLKMLW